MAKDVNNFYFESFIGDYYLTRDAEGVSRLKVVEEVTAVFPEYDQNKGICRQIAYTNQGGVNTTLPNLSRGNLKLLRNGVSEPIYSIEKGDGYYDVCTGDESYVRGRQVYTFEYEFEKVVTEFEGYQELYWDTNGNGATQRFDKVMARVHFDPAVYAGENWCYVGRYGESGEGRCKVSTDGEGVLVFTAENLKAYENLTFDLLLRPGSFVVPEPDRNYGLVWLLVGASVVSAIIIVVKWRKFAQVSEKRMYYKGMFIKPEYQPHAKYGVAEMAAVWIGPKRNEKVAVLLEMIVKKKVTIYRVSEEGARKKKWGIKIVDAESLRAEEKNLLRILSGGVPIESGEKFELKKRQATSELVGYGKRFDSEITREARTDGLAEEEFKAPENNTSKGAIVTTAFTAMIMVAFVALFVVVIGEDVIHNILGRGMVVGSPELLIVTVVVVGTAVVVCAVLGNLTRRYTVRTKKGLEASRYMDGLKLYIEMAEAERMKMLQSVKGADTSAEGVVRLYEKLLPYAAVFGLEESWMNELSKYYEMNEVAKPDWYASGIMPMDMIRMSHLMSDYSRTATVMASSGGASSSGGSGSFGGGFSGGGGGGGGFSGR